MAVRLFYNRIDSLSSTVLFLFRFARHGNQLLLPHSRLPDGCQPGGDHRGAEYEEAPPAQGRPEIRRLKGRRRQILNVTDGSEKPVGEWNSMTIEALGNEIIVHLNGDLVNHGANATVSKGKIALQAEGSEVEFRKVELTTLGTTDSPEIRGAEKK